MNPLMDALKSAEHARPASAAHGADGSPSPAASQSLSLAGEGPADGGAPARPLFIDAASTPFERRPDDLPHSFIPAEPARVMVDDADPVGLRIRRPPPERSGVGESRSATRRAFDPRTLPPRRGIGRLIGTTLSLLVVIGIGTGGGYFIWKTEFVRPALVRHLSPMPVAAMEPAPAHAANAAMDVTGGSAAGAAPETGVNPAVSTRDDHLPEPVPSAPSPGAAGRAEPDGRDRLSGVWESTPTEPAPPAVGPIARAPADASAGAANLPVPAMEHAGVGPPSAPGAGIEIRKRIRADHVTASLERAYAALLGGDAESAAEAYRAVLGHEPANRDAYLGLAAVAVQAGRWDEAAGHYTRILASHPADTVARAALIAIAEQDPARGESRLKALLWSEPRAAHLHFNLCNLYAAQSRWPEAQQSYFNAHRFDLRNADYAYNLAVSLDHLSQPESALGLYREALVLSRSRPASFEAEAVLQRIRDLDAPVGADFTSAPPVPETSVAAPAARVR